MWRDSRCGLGMPCAIYYSQADGSPLTALLTAARLLSQALPTCTSVAPSCSSPTHLLILCHSPFTES